MGNYDPNSSGNTAWDLYREMWGSNGEFVIDGNMTSVEYTDRLSSIKVPTLIAVGDHDECDPSLSQEMHEKIADFRGPSFDFAPTEKSYPQFLRIFIRLPDNRPIHPKYLVLACQKKPH
jgi:pimeloyl-ACP methyl ester carboxylesterase